MVLHGSSSCVNPSLTTGNHVRRGPRRERVEAQQSVSVRERSAGGGESFSLFAIVGLALYGSRFL